LVVPVCGLRERETLSLGGVGSGSCLRIGFILANLIVRKGYCHFLKYMYPYQIAPSSSTTPILPLTIRNYYKSYIREGLINRGR
jgi:hypothetical protein